MDHNLEDTLNLENAMGVDFGSTEAVEVSEAELILPDSSHESVPMEFEQIEEQPMLMDTGNEEIIDFMGDQFTLQEYSVQDDQTTGLTTTAESNQNVLSEQAEAMVDLQLQPQSAAAVVQDLPKLVTVKAASAGRLTSTKKNESNVQMVVPRQVAIAPKPSKFTAKPYAPGKQFAIAPKPVALVTRNTMLKKVSLANVQGTTKGNTVLAQIGKQLVMVPAGAQKLKLVSAANSASSVQYVKADPDQPQLIAPKESQPKPVMMTKVIVQGNPNIDLNSQPVVITKLMPTTSTKSPQTRVVSMQQKTVPITIQNKVVMASPTKPGVKLGKNQQIITIRSPTPKLLPAPPSGATAKKLVLSTNPPQNVILKTTAPPKNAQVANDGSVVVEAQQTQLHQINVPGKGIQYIRLVTNATPATSKGKGGSVIAVPSKFVLTDGKGGKPQKLLRIAPVMSKSQVATQAARPAQSLLAPLSPLSPARPARADLHPHQAPDDADSKTALRSLIQSTFDDADAGAGDVHLSVSEVEVEYKKPSPKHDGSRSVEQSDPADRGESHHSLIVIPSAFNMSDNVMSDEISKSEESQRSMISIEAEGLNSFQSPDTPQTLSEPEVGPTELGLRPRKACNCTKSQCLKLYCDCFANGEFCNRCNCNNCHNNLENEELRQKAIRGCLERNPNAFRPKIGKAKIGGPEIIRRHNKGCNCKRSGCLKNYCECYEAKIACTSMCKCVGCRNVEESLERARRSPRSPRDAPRAAPHAPHPPHAPHAPHQPYRPPPPPALAKQPCSFMTNEVIEAVCQCLLAAAVERGGSGEGGESSERDADKEPLRDVIEEFARCLQDIISAAHQAPPLALLEDVRL